MRRLYATTDEQPVMLNCGHRLLGKPRWDHPIQATVNTCEEEPWQDHEQDREAWKALKQTFVARVLRKNKIGDMVPLERHMMHAGAVGMHGVKRKRHGYAETHAAGIRHVR